MEKHVKQRIYSRAEKLEFQWRLHAGSDTVWHWFKCIWQNVGPFAEGLTFNVLGDVHVHAGQDSDSTHPATSLLGGGLNSRHLPKTHATTAGTQKNRISRHRQNSHHQQQITLCTAHSAHPLTSPSLNQTMRTLCRTPRKFIPTLTPTTANHTVHGSFNTPATDITKP